jgi:VWFA-related protein
MVRLVCLFLVQILTLPVAVSGQETSPPTSPPSPQLKSRPAAPAEPLAAGPHRRINLDVQVTDKSGTPIRGLQEQDFTILDDKQPKKITSFRAVDAGDAATAEPVEIILVVDAVNTPFSAVAYERDQVKKFLLQKGGQLAWPVSLVVFTDTETKIQGGSSRDGNATAAMFDQIETGLRTINRSQGFWGAEERIDMSLKALGGMVESARTRAGRKLIIWFSRGWPMLSERTFLTPKAEQQLFHSIVTSSADLREARITLYSVDPAGAAGGNVSRNNYFEDFLKGVTSPSRALPGDMGLQVLAVQSGGLVFYSSNDLVDEIADCVADANAYYVLSFDSLPADRQDEYHVLQIKVDKAGMVARTRTGYYAHP